MKKAINLIIMLLTFITVRAEDVLQILPQQIHIGSTSADGRSFSIQMNNEATFTAFQMDLYLPEGMELDERDPIVLVKDRFPHEEGRYGITFDHEVLYTKRSDGAYRILVSSNINAPINGNNGDLLTVYYVTDPTMQDGIQPVKIKNVVMAISGTEGVRHTETSSYFYTENTNFTSLSSLNLSALTGAIYQDVLKQTNELIKNNTSLSEINLSGADSISMIPEVQNINCIYYVRENSPAAKFLSEAKKTINVVAIGNQGNHCERLVLTDGFPALFTLPFTASQASYSRNVPSAGWYSLCLPYTTESPEDVFVEKFSSLNGNTIIFSHAEITAHNPCIFYTSKLNVEFAASDVAIQPAPEELVDNLFIGTYRQIPASNIVNCYALHSDGSGFGITGNTTYIPPFRAYVHANGQGNKIRLIHDQETAINDQKSSGKIKIDQGINWIRVEACCDKQLVTIYTPDGKCIYQNQLNQSERKTFFVEKGLYLVNNIKIIVK